MEPEYSSVSMLDFGEDGGSLVPVVTQDADSREVLILAFANREALAKSFSSGYATYYSRSRKVLWRKGESSGNLLSLVEVRVNCEQNSLLYLVRQVGEGSCHAKRADGRPHTTCFYRKLNADGTLDFHET